MQIVAIPFYYSKHSLPDIHAIALATQDCFHTRCQGLCGVILLVIGSLRRVYHHFWRLTLGSLLLSPLHTVCGEQELMAKESKLAELNTAFGSHGPAFVATHKANEQLYKHI